jgi:AraC-like DNA-binding protein
MHPCELFWVQVRPRIDLFRELEKLQHRHFSGGPILVSHFERLLAEYRNSGSGELSRRRTVGKSTQEVSSHSVIAARAALRLLVLDTIRYYQAAIQQDNQIASPSPPIASAMQWMHQHFGDHDCLEQAIQTTGLRGTQFRKRFQAETGFAPHDYLVRAQVEEAKRRLAQTREPITEMAFDLGFSSSQYFATVFRKLVGLTPQTYRRYHAPISAPSR